MPSPYDVVGEYLDILAAYDPGAAETIEEHWRAGVDVTDPLYESLAIYDEAAADGFLSGCLIDAAASDPDMRGRDVSLADYVDADRPPGTSGSWGEA